MLTRVIRKLLLGILCALAASPAALRAQSASPTGSGRPASVAGSRLLEETTARIDLRIRAELGRQDGTDGAAGPDDALARTARLRAGLLSGVYRRFQGYIELEHTEALGEQRYNAAPGAHGSSLGDSDKVVIADPESNELNQAWLSYASFLGKVRLGRQRITLDEQRFIGNVGFRQNEQTYDGAVLEIRPSSNLELFYAWIYRVNRIFGSRSSNGTLGPATRSFGSRSHLAQVTYHSESFGTLRSYAHFLDLRRGRELDASSSDTLGASWTAQPALSGVNLALRAEYALQSHAHGAAVSYRTHYYHLRTSARLGDLELGAAREVLGTDRGARNRRTGSEAPTGFATPLATLHAFNGFADLFLVTPSDGLVDDYAFSRFALPGKIRAEFALHRFRSESGGRDYGRELDAVLTRPLPRNTTALLKVASYRVRDPAPNIDLRSTLRITAQLEFRLN